MATRCAVDAMHNRIDDDSGVGDGRLFELRVQSGESKRNGSSEPHISDSGTECAAAKNWTGSPLILGRVMPMLWAVGSIACSLLVSVGGAV